MPTPQTHITLSKKSMAYFFSGLFLFIAAILLWTQAAKASHISYDPYADSVNSTSNAVVDANNAVGAPNGTNASLAGVSASMTLDMGAGEDGTRTLRVYLGQINVHANLEVAFLDGNKSVITSESRQIGADVNPSVQNFAFNWTDFGRVYRYVRLSSSIGGGVNVDAVEALGYIGSTNSQDTDGDGRTDRFEQHNGTNPIVRDSQPGTTTQTGDLPGINDHSGGTGSGSGQVNAPPKANEDQDKDGIPNNWETKYGLNPANKNDGQGDGDHDGLTNLIEYQIGSDPRKEDTDGDGMPDKWEYDNGLNVRKHDADADPDGDYLTNLGEYRNGTDPNKADDLFSVFGRDCKSGKLSSTDWLLIILLLLGALVAWWLAYGSDREKTTRKR